ncbi:MAG: chromosome segregation protein SMC [Promethearchaeota archaeon]
MAYIRAIRCEGFKSFRRRTVVKFDRGFSAIVGANGSGKSNIIDALVFVLGNLSAKTVRARKMVDVISNGGKNQEPAKVAKVQVEFDNRDRQIPLDADVVKISRRISRSGKGTYKINGKTTTRAAILELLDLANLLPTSTNVVMQGELFRLINMSPDERRGMIEEIAGIAAYDEKKMKAEEELERTEQNISQITVLLNEVAGQVEALEGERNDALEFQECAEVTKKARRALLQLEVERTKRDLEKLGGEMQRIAGNLEEIRGARARLREELGEATSALDETNRRLREMEGGATAALAKSISRLKDELTRAEMDRKNLRESVRERSGRVEKLRSKIQALTRSKVETEARLEALRARRAELKRQLRDLEGERQEIQRSLALDDESHRRTRQEMAHLSAKVADEREVRAKLTSELQAARKEEASLERDLRNVEGAAEETSKKGEKIRRQLQEALSRSELGGDADPRAIQGRIDEVNRDNARLEVELKGIREALEKKRDKLVKLKSKFKYAKLARANDRAVEEVLKAAKRGELQGVHGTIRQLGTASARFDVALQVAGGARFNHVVVDDKATARECIQFLKRNKLGRASFIPLREIRVSPPRFKIPASREVVGRAVELISFEPQFEKAFEFVFGKTLVVSDLRTASDLALPVRRVTLDGDVVEASNLMTGGSFKKATGRGFDATEAAEVPKLEEEVAKLKERESDLVRNLRENQELLARLYRKKISAEKSAAEISVRARNLEERLEEAMANARDLELKAKELASRLEVVKERKRHLSQQEERAAERLEQLSLELERLKDELESEQNSELGSKLQGVEDRFSKTSEELRAVEIEVVQCQTKLSESITKQLEQLDQDLRSETRRVDEDRSTIEALSQQIKEIQEELERLRAELDAKNQQLAEFVARKNAQLEEVSKIKLAIEELSAKVHPLELESRTLELKAAERRRALEELEADPLASIPLDHEYSSLDAVDLLAIVREKESRMKQLEPINMKAIEAYDRCASRFEEIKQKHERVVQEREAILQFMEDVEREKKKVFVEHFDAINRNFSSIFAKLSPGGEAKLELEDVEDPFAGGVNMLARPGGKKWCLTQAMSGGEKTLTVIALVLGIQMHVPSPYYVLDEIDAALDDENASKVADLIRELSHRSQFILITHRDVTMARVDQLLGVANVDGVTSVINMNLQEVLEQLVPAQ